MRARLLHAPLPGRRLGGPGIALLVAAAALAQPSDAATRTATISVSVQVINSCRLDVDRGDGKDVAPTHRGRCTGAMKPATKAVAEPALKRIRYDIVY